MFHRSREKVQAVEDALDGAVAIAWDGCHKIYVIGDAEARAHHEEVGGRPIDLDEHLVTSTGLTRERAAMLMIGAWCDGSCALRFVQRVDGATPPKYTTVIAQSF